MTYTTAYIRTLPAPSTRKLLRAANWTQVEIGREHAKVHRKKKGCKQSVVSRLIRKQIVSQPLWETIVWCLNHPKVGAV